MKNNGDIAVKKYTKKFDGFNPQPMQVAEGELKDAWDKIDSNLKHSLEGLVANIFNRICFILSPFHTSFIDCLFRSPTGNLSKAKPQHKY